VLGGDTMPSMCFCQIAGQSARIEAATFKQVLQTCPHLQRVLLRYTQAIFSQVAQAAACNRMHPIEERCARWLLMSHDRVGADHFMLTQEFLAQMLGVRRPSVSVAAGMLQKAGLITYSRGLVVITDRAGLEAAACNCYKVIQDEFDRLLQ
jgi:CRP-like cAMP-binding protein